MPQRSWWVLPSLHIEEEQSRHRKVSWLELYFDLFFVVAIAQLSHGLAEDVSPSGFASFVLLFIPVWWVWIGFTFYNERFETNGLENRLFTFLLMVPTAGLAVFAHHGTTENYAGYALSYVGARGIINALWVRAGIHAQGFRRVGIWYGIGFSLSMVLVTLSIFADGPVRYVLMGLGLASDLLTPLLTRPLQRSLPRFSSSKLPERFGLFTLIVLGETIVGVINGVAGQELRSAALLVIGALGLALGFGVWWIYFDFIGRRPFRPTGYWPITWSYGHMPMMMGIVGMGAGILNVVAHGDAPVSANVQLLIAGSVGTTLLLTALLEVTLVRHRHEPTHPVVSPLLKLITALAALSVGFWAGADSAPTLLCILFLLLAVNMSYGSWCWFRQDVASGDEGHES